MDPPPEDDQRVKRKRPWEPEDDDSGAIPESSRAADEEQRQDRSSGSMDDRESECKHRIFLSHSGRDKDFVEELCEDLEKCYRFPFFDKRSSSLPKGESFPELIVDAARNCEVGVVVVSDEYFMSKWPMIELDAFVQTWLMQKKHMMGTKLKILPLFYGLSVAEFGEEERRAKWLSKWDDLAKVDPRIDVERWKGTLRVLASFNGIEYDWGTRKKAYRDAVVEQICNEVPPDVKWDDSHVQGGSKICQMIEEAISGIQPSHRYGVRVVGVYGVGGMGKTTLCNCLGNRLFQKQLMKASHVELGSKGYGELLKEVLKECTNTNEVVLQGLDEGKRQFILFKEARKQKVFLAIDNVWPNTKSLDEAKKFLQLGFHKESIVLVTSRALETLTSLGISKCDCFEMPGLDDEDAKKLFLYHAAYGIQFPNASDKEAIESCVRLCYFRKGNRKDGHYLPLALKALGIQLGCIGNNPCEWVKAFPRIRDFNYLEEEKNPVFSILKSSFDCLKSGEQNLVFDLVLYYPTKKSRELKEGGCVIGRFEWLALVHNQSFHEIQTMVLRLKERGLVEAVDMAAQKVYIHDLYREFARLEAQGRLEDLPFERRKWVYFSKTCPSELLEERGCWKNLTRLRMLDDNWHNEVSCIWIERIKWGNCPNIVVLELICSCGSLDLKGLKRLKSLNLSGVHQLDGLQDLTDLSYFQWEFALPDNHSRMVVQKFPPSLKVLHLDAPVWLSPEAFDMCVNLATLKLKNCSAGNLDFESCSSLQSVDITGLFPSLEAGSYLSVSGLQDLTSLTRFSWSRNKDLSEDDLDEDEDEDEDKGEGLLRIVSHKKYHKRLLCQLPASIEELYIDATVFLRSGVFARCTKLSELDLSSCHAENLELGNCTSLQSLCIVGLQRLDQSSAAVPDRSLCNLQDLRNLTYLRLVSFRNNEGLCYKLDQLPASLRILDIDARVLLGLGVFDGCVSLTKLKLKEDLKDSDDHEDNGRSYYKMGPLPASLEVLVTNVRMSFGSDALDRCVNLTKLELQNSRAEILDLSNCTSLQSLELVKIERLQTIVGLSAVSARLLDLKVDRCDNLEGIPELPDLVCLGWLQLNGLACLWNLRLSGLSGLTELMELSLVGSNVELREEDVCLLASLPRLKHVAVSGCWIDVVRRKLIRSTGYLKSEEKDLGMLPMWTNEICKFWE